MPWPLLEWAGLAGGGEMRTRSATPAWLSTASNFAALFQRPELLRLGPIWWPDRPAIPHLPCPHSGTNPGQFASTAHGIHLGRIKGDYTICSYL